MKESAENEKCAHPPCNCTPTTGDYCSEQCRSASANQTNCTCGHRHCQ